MKSHDQNGKNQNEPRSEQRKLGKPFSRAKVAAALFVLSGLAAGAALAPFTDFCLTTANKLLRSCNVAAQSDSVVALAKCDNISDAAERQGCQNEARNELKDALGLCKEQQSARKASCRRLGGERYEPTINPANFVATIDNPFFPLTPGTTFIYEGQTVDGLEHVEFAVTHNTKVILGVTCNEVHDTVKLNGELTEDTLDWFAQDEEGNVWYFGENTHELVDGLITSIDGSFIAGENGAKPGIIMKAHPMVGDFYRQEFDLGNAEDLADVVSLNESVPVPAGSFTNCLKTQETTPLEPELLEYKFYAPGVGNLLTVDAITGDRSELIQITTNN